MTYTVPTQLSGHDFPLARQSPQEGRQYTTVSKAGPSPWDFPFCRDEQYYPPASAVVIGLKHSRTTVVPKGVTWNEYLSSWQRGGWQLEAYQNLTGNADSERLKTTIRLSQCLWTVNRRRGWKKIIPCAAPDVIQVAASPTGGFPLWKTTPTPLTLSWKDSQEQHFSLHINKQSIML